MGAVYIDALRGALDSPLNDTDVTSTMVSAALAGTPSNPGCPTIESPDYVRISLFEYDASGVQVVRREDVLLMPYTEGDHSGTIVRAQNGTTEQAWLAGALWAHGWTSADVGVSAFPDFEGSGPPEGVITATLGQWYRDTANGALYVMTATGPQNTQWMAAAGLIDAVNFVYEGALGSDFDSNWQRAWGDSGQFYFQGNDDGSLSFPGSAFNLYTNLGDPPTGTPENTPAIAVTRAGQWWAWVPVGGSKAVMTANSGPVFPVVVTGSGGGATQGDLDFVDGPTFQLANGTYSDLAELESALLAATGGGGESGTLADWVTITDDGTHVILTAIADGGSGTDPTDWGTVDNRASNFHNQLGISFGQSFSGGVNPTDEWVQAAAAGVASVVAGDGIAVDNTDSANPVVSNDGVIMIIAGEGVVVDDTDPQQPVVSSTGVTAVSVNTDEAQVGFASVLTPRQPLVPFSGVIQPSPPLVGFDFPGTPIDYPLGATGEALYYLCAGSDHNIWIADTSGGVWRVNPETGAFTHFLASTPIGKVCSGPDGNIWAVGASVYQIDVATGAILNTITPAGLFSLNDICSGPDGNLWVTDVRGTLYRITTGGEVTTFFGGGGALGGMRWICSGPDGNMWATGDFGNVYVIALDGTLLATHTLEGVTQLGGICTGPDNNLWVTNSEDTTSYVWRVTPSGTATKFGPATGGSEEGTTFFAICAGAGGDLWAADSFGYLYKITVLGAISVFPGSHGATGICSGPDGGLWMTGYSDGSVVVFPFTGVTGALRLTGGPLSTRVLTTTGAYAMNGSESVMLATGAVTLPPPAASFGSQFTVKDSGSGTASLHPHASETIDGGGAVSLAAYKSVTVTSDGTNWYEIGRV